MINAILRSGFHSVLVCLNSNCLVSIPYCKSGHIKCLQNEYCDICPVSVLQVRMHLAIERKILLLYLKAFHLPAYPSTYPSTHLPLCIPSLNENLLSKPITSLSTPSWFVELFCLSTLWSTCTRCYYHLHFFYPCSYHSVLLFAFLIKLLLI